MEETSALIDQGAIVYSGFREDFRRLSTTLDKFYETASENAQTSYQ